MEMINECSALLCNYEVLSLLQEIQNKPKDNPSKSQINQNFSTVMYEAIRYLKSTPIGNMDKNKIQNFIRNISQYNLTKAEKLMLINLQPTSMVELQLIIEENEERLSEDQVQKLLELIKKELHS